MGRLDEINSAHYYLGECSNKPYDLELLLLIYVLQNLYDLADEPTVSEVIDVRDFSIFCDISSSNQIPSDEL